MNAVIAPTCPTCRQAAEFRPTSEHIYNGRDYGPVWFCPRGCDAYVSVHEGTQLPKGTLATKPMRQARRAAHAVFDVLWDDLRLAYPDIPQPGPHLRSIARKRAYAWLAFQLGIAIEDTHIAMFDQAQCQRVVQIVEAHKPTCASVREWFKAQQGQAAESGSTQQ
jgi:hypothetical protein